VLDRLRFVVPKPVLRPITAAHARLSTRLIPPPHLHSVGPSNFEIVGDNYLEIFKNICGLRPDDRVLDVGCGTGRIARPLTMLLTSGTYQGFDIVEESIYWCTRAYRRFPNFTFVHADIRNTVYNPGGRLSAADYRFPFPDRSGTFVILTSVFTHMLPPDVEHYLRELSRVLAPDGRAFATFFLLNDASREGIRRGVSQLQFTHHGARTWHQRPDDLEAAVAYDESDVRQMCDRAGLSISSLHYGAWSGRSDGFDWQDVAILRRLNP
jgi:SAM-dependent methyltransferase